MKSYQQRFTAMGTPCEIQLYAVTHQQAQGAANAAMADVHRLEARYSRYREDSFLSAINRVAVSGGSIQVDHETAVLLDYAATCYQQSGGLFDVTSGILRQAWNFNGQRLPDTRLIESLLARVGWRKLRWASPVLEFLQPGMEIDLGGVVKEYAVDRAASLCMELGVVNGMINLGGDIRILGPHADGTPWRVGIRHPRHTDGLLSSVELHSGALASSGDYERCINVAGVRYGHVLNPVTGWPASHMAAVSVVADFCVVAGSASTIGMLKESAGKDWLRELGLPHLWVDVDGQSGGSLVHV